MAACFRIGTSGFHYKHWQERFYPRELPARAWLAFYARTFDTVELNNSFYRLPEAAQFAAWAAQVPEGFVFAVKASRFITHIKRLREPEEPLARLFEHAGALGPKLGPVLYQLPPSFPKDIERLRTFLAALPQHRAHVIEFRHPSWFDAETLDVLRSAGVAFCCVDSPQLKSPVEATARFAYLRFHGSAFNWGDYSEPELRDWAGRLRGLAAVCETVYVYFNNDWEGFAIKNALTLRRMLS
jgi:uncharacterized protein YecE (DUF72 family)